MSSFSNYFKPCIRAALILVPALLLTTKNFSIALIVASILVSTIYLAQKSNRIKLDKFDFLVIFCMSTYLIGAIPIAIYDGTTARYFQGGVRIILCIPIYFALKLHIENSNFKIKDHLDIGVILGCVGAFSFACYQYFSLGLPRVDGFLFSINYGFLACSLSLLALTLHFKSKFKYMLLFCSVIGMLTVILTFTRGAMFAIPIILVVITCLKFKKIKKTYIILSSIVLIASSMLMYNYSSDFHKRINYTLNEFSLIASGDIIKSSSSTYRVQYWQAAFEAFKTSPLIGLPYTKREELNHKLYLDGKISEGASTVTRGHAHSQYFEMLASNGVLGILSIISILVVPFLLFVSHYKKYGSDWAFSAAVFVLGFAIFGLTEVPLTANLIGSFYGFMLAVFFAIIAAERQGKRVL